MILPVPQNRARFNDYWVNKKINLPFKTDNPQWNGIKGYKHIYLEIFLLKTYLSIYLILILGKAIKRKADGKNKLKI